MDLSRTLRIETLQDQIWLLHMRVDEMRSELPSNPAGSQGRIEAERDLTALRAQMRGLVRERVRLGTRR
jgi:hypothetical protein